MPKEYARSERVAQLIYRELAVILRNEVNDPRVTDLTITEVTVSKDCRQAKVFVASLLNDPADEDALIKVLQKASGFLRHQLAEKVEMRRCPDLSFVYDNSIRHSAEISAMIDAALKKE